MVETKAFQQEVQKTVASKKGKGSKVFILDWTLTANDFVEEEGVAPEIILSLPLPRDADCLATLIEEEFKRVCFLDGAKDAEREKAESKVVEESSQKIIALLGEVEQLTSDMDRLRAEVVDEKELGIKYRAQCASKNVELEKSRAALATYEEARRRAEDDTQRSKFKTR
ncbi:hypothetical protein NE237_022571 [Protea cynaroides]|uniref:Uncharacterized protein n=1 Tax=Protea cynaroides TaxID=273540 RepID=A0A9Q0HA10_9MAGN|nr:hypothetical protein NE237_022571 [Protea cynaroides]